MMLEKDRLPNGDSVIFFYFFQPWSQFNIDCMARLYDTQGKQIERVTLESNDSDQASFQQQHPQEAAKGVRFFSVDGYSDHPGPPGSAGTQSHASYEFFNGRPTLDTFHDLVLAIATGAKKPIARTDGIPLPGATVQ